MEFVTAKRNPPEVNLSALIDIAFILVIFVILAASFDRIDVLGLNLPQSSSESPAQREALEIKVPETGPILIEGRPFAGRTELVRELTRLREHHSSIVLLTDGEADIQKAITVMDAAQSAGFQSASIATHAIGP